MIAILGVFESQTKYSYKSLTNCYIPLEPTVILVKDRIKFHLHGYEAIINQLIKNLSYLYVPTTLVYIRYSKRDIFFSGAFKNGEIT